VKTIIVGLGNPILGDDGVGWQVASRLQQVKELPPDVSIDNLAVGGISLMEAMIGYDRAIIVDSIVTEQAPIGDVNLHHLDDLPKPASGHTSSAHDATLPEALKMGKALGAQLPEEISIVTIESHKVYEFSDELTPDVEAAVPRAVGIILDLLLESRQGQAPKPNDLKG
jgi:hydrogenase maturation protease